MTPIEKAKELVDKYFQIAENIEWTTDEETKEKSEKYNDDLGNDVLIYWNRLAKESALIAVDEIIEFAYNYTDYNEKSTKEYWIEVKQEIENL